MYLALTPVVCKLSLQEYDSFAAAAMVLMEKINFKWKFVLHTPNISIKFSSHCSFSKDGNVIMYVEMKLLLIQCKQIANGSQTLVVTMDLFSPGVVV